LALDTAYLAGDLATPGGIDAPLRLCRGEVSLVEALYDQSCSAGAEMAFVFALGKVVRVGKKVGSALVKSENALTHIVIKTIAEKNFSKSSVAKKVKSWQVRKAKIRGKAQVTGTPGHDWQSMREAIKATKDPNVARVHMDQSLSRVTGGKVPSRMRPDVTVVRKDGRINMIEVQSESQRRPQLEGKIQEMQDLLPPEMRGRDIEKGGKVFEIK
jgi:hypothetical protein